MQSAQTTNKHIYSTLQHTYKQWQQLQSKGQLKMRIKLDKDNKQYYDFDFSRYQYYYNYPEDHYAFLPPQKQQQLFKIMIKNVLNAQHKGFDCRLNRQKDNNKSVQIKNYKNHCEEQNYAQESQKGNCPKLQYSCEMFKYLKPYELQEFFYDYTQRIHKKITCLRIKKSLLTPMKVNEFLKDTQTKANHTSAIIQLIQTQIRSYLGKLSKITSYDFQFGQNIAERFQQKKSHLKTSNRDEMHFSPLQKSDFIIYQRLIKTDYKISFPINCIKEQISLLLKTKHSEIKREAYTRRLKILNKIYEQQKIQHDKKRQVLISWLTQNEPHFLEQFSNVSAIDEFLKNITYTNKLSASKSHGYLDINMHYTDVKYIPANRQQLSELATKVCQNYFTTQMLQKLLGRGKDKRNYSQQHLCYKLIRLGSTVFRITQQTYELTGKKQDRDILSKRVLMRRQLQTVFAKDVDKLLNVPQHEIVHLAIGENNESNYAIPQLQQTITNRLTEKQLIYDKYFQQYQFQDPILYSLGNLLFVRKEKNLHDVVDEYITVLKKKNVFGNKLKHLMLYYDNIHSDPKNHLINVMNKKLSLAHQQEHNPNFNKFLNILQHHNSMPLNKLSPQLLKSVYFLQLVTTINQKNQLLQIINGQVNIIYRTKHRLLYLKKKGAMRFELSKQWMTRFMETNQKKEDAFDFVRDVETVDEGLLYEAHGDRLVMSSQILQVDKNDKIINTKKHTNNNNQPIISVRRTSPQNPLYQGKKIIYPMAIKQLQQLILERLLKLGSWIIQRRQNYLSGEELTHIVDRVELLYELVERQKRLQLAKLKLMNEYFNLLQQCANPKGIELLTTKIYQLKHTQFSFQLNQHTFIQQYQQMTKSFQLKLKLLKLLVNVVRKYEQKQICEVKNGMMRRNLPHNMPQISSIYYHESSKVGGGDGGEEGIEEQAESDEEDIQREDKYLNVQGRNVNNNGSSNYSNKIIQPNSSRSESLAHSVMLETSQFSNSLNNKSHYKYSDYHVKKSFRQILNMNETTNIKKSAQKKQLLLNRKKKKLLNDTVLGLLLQYSNINRKQQSKCNIHNHHRFKQHSFNTFSQHIHIAIQIIQNLQSRFQLSSNQSSSLRYNQTFLQNTAMERVIQTIQQQRLMIDDLSAENNCFFNLSEEMLPLCLHECARMVSKLVQKVVCVGNGQNNNNNNITGNNNSNSHFNKNTNNISNTGSSYDQQLQCFPKEVIQKIIQNKTGQQINPYRGLYLALNHVQLVRLFNQSMIMRYKQHRVKNRYLSQMVQNYSTYKFAANQQSMFIVPLVLQSPLLINANNKIYTNILSPTQNNSNQHLLLICQYNTYIKSTILIDNLFLQYYQLLIQNLSKDYIQEYEDLLLELELIYKGNCWFGSGKQNGLQRVSPGKVENKVWVGKKIQFMEKEVKKTVLAKENIAEFLVDIPNKLVEQCITTKALNKPSLTPPTTTQHILTQSNNFSQYLQQIFTLITKLLITNSRLFMKLSTKQKIEQINQLIKILPHLNQKIIINEEESRVFSIVFAGDFVDAGIGRNSDIISGGIKEDEDDNAKEWQQGDKIVNEKNDDNDYNNSNEDNSNNNLRKQQPNKTNLITISHTTLKPSYLNTLLVTLSNPKSHSQLTNSIQSIFIKITQRQYHQFKSKQQSQNEKRTNNNYLFKLFNINCKNGTMETRTFLNKLTGLVKFPQQYQLYRLNKLLILIQTKLLLFALTQLTVDEQLNLRILLQTQKQSFTIFWKDETSNLIKSPQFVKLKNFKLQSQHLLERYRRQYVVYGNLKNKYKTMIDKLRECDLEEEMEDSLYLLVNCLFFVGVEGRLKNMVESQCTGSLTTKQCKGYFNYLYKFGDHFQRPDQMKQFFTSILKQRLSLTKIYKRFNFNILKKSLLSSSPCMLTKTTTMKYITPQSKFNLFREFQQRSGFLRHHINSLKQKKQPQITMELFHFNLMKFTLSKVLKNVGIDSSMHRQKLQIFSKKFIQKVNQNSVILTQRQRQILELTPINSQVRSRFQSLKDQAFQSVYFIKYYQQILLNKMFQISTTILTKQLQLRKCLGDSFQQRQLSMDNKVYTQTLNKVLAPKVMLNPFLNSPLLVDDYFFAGTLKLSYIDQFLNRMKNRAIMVEMAQGGFGFLLKVSEIDQCVNALCKGIVAFSEKEFHDRLRTYFQYTDQLKQKLIKTKTQNQHLKQINKLHAFYDEKQIKSLLYEKLNSYIECITDKQKTYKTLFSMFKNIQNDLMKQCSQQYSSRIKQLEEENYLLKQTYKDFEQKLKKGALTNVNQSRDKLYGEFKQKVQKVLNKEVIPQYNDNDNNNNNRPTFIQTQAYESEILLQKLKQQSIVTKLKTNLTNKQYEKRILQLQRKLLQKQQLLNQIKQQREKSFYLKQQVKQLANKAIEVQALERQRRVDLQERMMEKFKLIRVNEALQGKLARLEGEVGKVVLGGGQGKLDDNGQRMNNNLSRLSSLSKRETSSRMRQRQRQQQTTTQNNNISNKKKKNRLNTQQHLDVRNHSNQQRQQQQKQSHNQTSTIFITRQHINQNSNKNNSIKKRSHTQFGMQSSVTGSLANNSDGKNNNSLLKSRIRKRSSIAVRGAVKHLQQTNGGLAVQQQQIHSKQRQHLHNTRVQNINVDQARVWRQRWQKSQTKYQKIVQKVKIIGENFKLTKNIRKLSEKIILLIDQINCQPVGKRERLNQLGLL